jgi:hypothetical protein
MLPSPSLIETLQDSKSLERPSVFNGYDSHLRDSLRLLFIIDAGAHAPANGAPNGAVGEVRSETRLQALDFWMRNPDYLAEELLNEYEQGQRSDGLILAEKIILDGEPDLRREPMLRFKFGAWEPLDVPLSMLLSRGLIDIKRLGDALSGAQDNIYYLMQKGRDAAQSLVKDVPALAWYSTRAQLVVSVAGNKPAGQLKLRQKEQQEYKNAAWGTLIPPITDRVKAHLEKLLKPGAK